MNKMVIKSTVGTSDNIFCVFFIYGEHIFSFRMVRDYFYTKRIRTKSRFY